MRFNVESRDQYIENFLKAGSWKGKNLKQENRKDERYQKKGGTAHYCSS